MEKDQWEEVRPEGSEWGCKDEISNAPREQRLGSKIYEINKHEMYIVDPFTQRTAHTHYSLVIDEFNLITGVYKILHSGTRIQLGNHKSLEKIFRKAIILILSTHSEEVL